MVQIHVKDSGRHLVENVFKLRTLSTWEKEGEINKWLTKSSLYLTIVIQYLSYSTVLVNIDFYYHLFICLSISLFYSITI